MILYESAVNKAYCTILYYTILPPIQKLQVDDVMGLNCKFIVILGFVRINYKREAFQHWQFDMAIQAITQKNKRPSICRHFKD